MRTPASARIEDSKSRVPLPFYAEVVKVYARRNYYAPATAIQQLQIIPRFSNYCVGPGAQSMVQVVVRSIEKASRSENHFHVMGVDHNGAPAAKVSKE